MGVRLHISGIVQGVGYRAAFEKQARKEGLSGWVRNRVDGTVEAIVFGPQEALQHIIDWAHEGPPLSSVERVRIEEVDGGASEHAGFSVLPTC